MFYTAIKYEKKLGWMLCIPRHDVRDAMEDASDNEGEGYYTCVLKTTNDLRALAKARNICTHMTERRGWYPKKLLIDFSGLDFSAPVLKNWVIE